MSLGQPECCDARVSEIVCRTRSLKTLEIITFRVAKQIESMNST